MRALTVIMAALMWVVLTAAGYGETQYRVLEVANYDIGPYKDHLGAKRTQYDIEVSEDASDAEVEKILRSAVEELKQRREVDALAVHLYLKGGKSPYAIANWAPGGEWGDAEAGTPRSAFQLDLKVYEERRPRKDISEGKGAVLKQDADLSRVMEYSGPEDIIIKVPKGTAANILQIEDLGWGLVKVRIKANVNGKDYEGWIYQWDLQE